MKNLCGFVCSKVRVGMDLSGWITELLLFFSKLIKKILNFYIPKP